MTKAIFAHPQADRRAGRRAGGCRLPWFRQVEGPEGSWGRGRILVDTEAVGGDLPGRMAGRDLADALATRLARRLGGPGPTGNYPTSLGW